MIKKFFKYLLAIILLIRPILLDLFFSAPKEGLLLNIRIILTIAEPFALILWLYLITSDLRKILKIIAWVLAIILPFIISYFVEFARFWFHWNSGKWMTDLNFYIIWTIIVIYWIVLILKWYREIKKEEISKFNNNHA